jgi:hypothetical protein
MTSVNITTTNNTVVVTENGASTVVTVPVTSVVTANTAGPQGPQGPQGPKGDAGAGYNFTQSSSSAAWTINHNLGFKPSVDVYDSGSQQIQAEVSHPSVNQTAILLTTPITGFARLT